MKKISLDDIRKNAEAMSSPPPIDGSPGNLLALLRVTLDVLEKLKIEGVALAETEFSADHLRHYISVVSTAVMLQFGLNHWVGEAEKILNTFKSGTDPN